MHVTSSPVEYLCPLANCQRRSNFQSWSHQWGPEEEEEEISQFWHPQLRVCQVSFCIAKSPKLAGVMRSHYMVIRATPLHTFVDYIRGGCEIGLMLAIDFTVSWEQDTKRSFVIMQWYPCSLFSGVQWQTTRPLFSALQRPSQGTVACMLVGMWLGEKKFRSARLLSCSEHTCAHIVTS